MGLHHSPSVVADGLIMCLDAGNPRSYTATSGNNWIDLSGNGFSGNLTSNTSYNSANLGSIVFDGTTTSRFNIPNTNYPSTWSSPTTIEVWIRIPSAATWTDGLYRSPIVSRGEYQGCIGIARTLNNNQVSLYVRGDTIATEAGTIITRDTWHQIVGVWTGREASMYVNGNLRFTFTQSGSLDGVPESNIWVVGGNNAFAGGQSTVGLNANVSSIKLYRRSLSAGEIQQNFNALRPRYGL